MEKNMNVTCIERKYKVTGNGLNYFITAKKELDHELTNKLLHEDMELKTFLTHYEVTSFQKEESLSQTDSTYDIINLENAKTYVNCIPSNVSNIGDIRQLIKHDIVETSELGEFPSIRIRENIILNNMPKEFALEDVVKFFMHRYKNYDTKHAKERFSATLQKLKREHKVEIINPDTNRRYRKYRMLICNTDSDRMINDQKEDKKVSIGNAGS
jgi:hypothetical protein